MLNIMHGLEDAGLLLRLAPIVSGEQKVRVRDSEVSAALRPKVLMFVVKC